MLPVCMHGLSFIRASWKVWIALTAEELVYSSLSQKTSLVNSSTAFTSLARHVCQLGLSCIGRGASIHALTGANQHCSGHAAQ